MKSDNFIYKHVPGRGLMSQTAYDLRKGFLKSIIPDTALVESTKLKLDQVQNNIESFIGSIEIPLGLAGPLLFDSEGKEENELVYTGICTTEGALVASINRGAKAISQCGGFRSHVIQQRMIRTPMFVFASLSDAVNFSEWINNNFYEIQKLTSLYSNHAKLKAINPVIVGKVVHLKFVYQTADASGQNMTTTCTWHACLWIEKEYQTAGEIKIDYYVIDGNGSSDKKVSYYSLQNGRGISVISECFIKNEILEKTLRTTADEMFRAYTHSAAISRIDGMVGYNINVSNVIAGIFAATGQDLGSIHESSIAVLQMEKQDDGLYLSLSLPGLVVGTVGGGTHLPAQKNILEMMGCAGNNKSERFANLISGFALALETSTLAAIVSGQFARSHQKLGRNKPIDWLVGSEINAKFIHENIGSVKGHNIETAEVKNLSVLDNGILSELSKKVSKKMIGLFPITMRLSSGEEITALIKSKPEDDELFKGLHYLASCLNSSLADLILRYKDNLEYSRAHLKEINIYEYLKKKSYKYIPDFYGSYINKEREIYLFLFEYLDKSTLTLFDSENEIEKWTDDHVMNCIEAIHSLHKTYLSDGESIEGLSEFKPHTSCPLYLKFNEINRKDYSSLDLDYIFNELESVIQKWDVSEPVKNSTKTLVHNDFNPRNIAVNGSNIYIYDWELASINIPQRDIFELLAFVLPTDFPNSRLSKLLDYHYKLVREINDESYNYDKYIDDLILAGYEFMITRASFYLAGSTIVDYSFIKRVFAVSHKIIESLKAAENGNN